MRRRQQRRPQPAWSESRERRGTLTRARARADRRGAGPGGRRAAAPRNRGGPRQERRAGGRPPGGGLGGAREGRGAAACEEDQEGRRQKAPGRARAAAEAGGQREPASLRGPRRQPALHLQPAAARRARQLQHARRGQPVRLLRRHLDADGLQQRGGPQQHPRQLEEAPSGLRGEAPRPWALPKSSPSSRS